MERTKTLASDDFEGRGPGTLGEERTVGYLVEEFKRLGLQPGNPDGTFVQRTPLVGITSETELSIRINGDVLPMENINDFVAPSSRVSSRVEVKDSEALFLGYGITAPEFDWDDFKDTDVRGKTLIVLINDPPILDAEKGALDPNVFGGKAMTYYGRWSYRYGVAAAKGAAACLIVHETGPASYPFGVVVTSWSRENLTIRRNDGNAANLAVQGWLTLDASKRLLSATGHDFDTLKKSAARRDFRPVALGAKASFLVQNTLRNMESRNVIALLPGADPKLRHEYVIYTAHWDHLGRDTRLTGDQIYNGAADNAGGVAMLLELAQTFKALPAGQQPRRSILFIAPTAEEKGLLGSRYYAENPLYPLASTLANINMDGVNQFGRTRDIEVPGYGASSIDDIGDAIAKQQMRTVRADAHPERGSYYRSDHFEFAKMGIPSYVIKAGRNYIGKPSDYGDRVLDEYIAKDYHRVSDEVKPGWTFEGAAQDAEFLFQVGLRIANGDHWPDWRQGNEFKAKRDTMLKQVRQ